MSDIREKKYDLAFYPSPNEIHESSNVFLPESLNEFLAILVKTPLKRESIGQSILLACRPRSCLPPIPFGLGVELDHVFGSKWLLNELSKLGFTMSYDEVCRFKQVVIQSGNDYHEDGKAQFIQYSADNVDHNIRTLDGRGTFHGMGIISMQIDNERRRKESNSKNIRRFTKKKSSGVLENKGVQIENYITLNRSALSTLKLIPLNKLETMQIDILQHSVDILWESVFFFHQDEVMFSCQRA